MKLFELTAKGRYYKVYQDGTYVSQHSDEREAIEAGQEILFSNPESKVIYRHEYGVEVALTTAGLTLAGTRGEQPVDLPPTIVSTPSPSFTQGAGQDTYNMSPHFSDDGLSTVTSSLTNTLPSGLSYNGNTHVLTYDGSGPASVSQHRLVVTDAVGSVQSAVFNISIQAVVEGGFVAHTPTNYVPRVRGACGLAFDSAFGTCQVGESFATVRIQRVVNTSDSGADGSERFAMSLNPGVRMTVVYDISGWRQIATTQSLSNQVGLTIARNTAPGLGFHSRGDGSEAGGNIVNKAHHSLWWHVSNAYNGPLIKNQGDSITTTGDTDHVAFVNCGFWFGYDSAADTQNVTNISYYGTLLAHSFSDQGESGAKLQLFDKAYGEITRCLYALTKNRKPLMGRQDANLINNINYGGFGHHNVNAHGTATPATGVRYNDEHNINIFGPEGQVNNRAHFQVVLSNNDPVIQNGAGWSEWLASKAYVANNRMVGALQTEFQDVTGLGTPFNRVGSRITEIMPHGFSVTPLTGLSNLEAANLILNNCGPRPANPLGYFAMVKNNVRAGVTGSGDQGIASQDQATDVYTGDGSGFDAVPTVTKDNFGEIASFLSANYTQGTNQDYELTASGTNFRTYRFKVDANTGYCPLDVWLNDVINDGVMNAGWEV